MSTPARRCGHADPVVPLRIREFPKAPRRVRATAPSPASAPPADRPSPKGLPTASERPLGAQGGTTLRPQGRGRPWRVIVEAPTPQALHLAVAAALSQLTPADLVDAPQGPALGAGGYVVTFGITPEAAARLSGRPAPPQAQRPALPAPKAASVASSVRTKTPEELAREMAAKGFYPNRKPGRCEVTRAEVKVGAGFIHKSGGVWHLYAPQVAYARAGVSLVATSVEEKPVLRLTFEDGWWKVRGTLSLFREQLRAAGFYTPKDALGQWQDWMQTRDPGGAAKFRQFADEATLGALARAEQAILDSNVAVGNCEGLLVPAGLRYLPYQCAAIRFGLALYTTGAQGLLFADEPGLGKTIEALGLVNNDPRVRKVLCICPSLVKINWAREAAKWLIRPSKIVVIDGDQPVPDDADFVIANFDIVKPYQGRDRRCFTDIMAREWDMLIVDEAHFLKNPEADRTVAVMGRERPTKNHPVRPGIITRCRLRVFLTGTPIDNRPIDLWTLIHALDPVRWKSWANYAYRYCGARNDGYGIKVTGATNTDELARILRSTVMVRRLKADVLKELPPKTRRLVILPNDAVRPILRRAFEKLALEEGDPDVERRLAEEFPFYERGMDTEEFTEAWIGYAEALREQASLAAISGDKAQYATISAKLQSLMRVGFEEMSKMRHDLALAKIPYAIEHLKELLDGGSNEKVMVMCHHHDVQDAMYRAVAEAFGPESVVMHRGNMGQNERQVSVDRFQTDPRARVFIGSILASGTGITLTAAAKGVFIEYDWKAGTMSQAEDRIHRVGQGQPVLIDHLAFNGTLDAYMIGMILDKARQADAIYNPDQRAAFDAQPAMPEGRGPTSTVEQWAMNLLAGYLGGTIPGQRDLKGGRRQGVEQALLLLSRGYGLSDKRWAFMVAMALYVAGASEQRASGFNDPPRPPATAVEEWAAEGLAALSAADADRATKLNDMGFSQATSSIGHTLSALIEMGRAGDDVWEAAVKLATFHGRQLPPKPGAVTAPVRKRAPPRARVV